MTARSAPRERDRSYDAREAAPLPPPRRRARGLPRARRRPAAGAAALAGCSRTRSGSRSVEQLADRFRVVLPDLPLHGDSEHRPRHPYTLDWFAEVLGGFARRGARPAAAARRPRRRRGDPAARRRHRARSRPARLVLMPNRLHAAPARRAAARGVADRRARRGRAGARRAALLRRARRCSRPSAAMRLSARGNPRGADLLRHAFADVPATRASRARGRSARALAARARRRSCSSSTRAWTCRCCCCGPTRTALHPLAARRRGAALLPDGQLRVLESTGFLMAYDDPVGLARELAAFCG